MTYTKPRAATFLALIFTALLLWPSIALPQFRPQTKKLATEQEVSFRTDDGWTIHGFLSIPFSLGETDRAPGVVLVHSPVHDNDVFGHTVYPTIRAALEEESAITLRIDIRGRGRSASPFEYHALSGEQRSGVWLDIKGAIDFLAAHPRVDVRRIGVVAEGGSSEAGLVAALRDSRVGALALLSGHIGEPAKKLIADREDLPVMGLVSKEDRKSFIDLTDVYRLSRNENSELMIFENLGIGNSLLISWAVRFPDSKPLENTVAEWIVERLGERSRSVEVSFQSADGWTLHGSLQIPGNDEQRAPGVVFVHSNLTDRHIFDNLEQMLAGAGFAVLNFDFRGRGKSIGKGRYFDLPKEEQDKGFLDVSAALSFLASQPGVDSNRLSVVASSVGVVYGLKAANLDERVKAFVMLGGLPDRNDVIRGRFPILFVSSLGVPEIASAFENFHRATQDRGSHLVAYGGAAIGYQIFEIDKTLEPLIVRWMRPLFQLD